MTTTDRTDADDATFAAEMDRLNRLDVADEGAEERVARAMAAAWHERYPNDNEPWENLTWTSQENFRFDARTSIAALKPAPGTDSSGQMVVDVVRGGEHVATLDAVYGSVSVDSSGQVVRRVLDECAALDEESRRAMKNADRAREREDRTMHAVNVRHSRIAHQAADRIRAAVAGPQRDQGGEGGQ